MPGEWVVTRYDARGRPIDTNQPAPTEPDESEPPEPFLCRTFEFRLCGSEQREESVPWLIPGFNHCVVAIQRVRAYLTRDGQPAAVPNAIAGLEIYADWQPERVSCTARLSDFAGGELVIVQVDVAVYVLN